MKLLLRLIANKVVVSYVAAIAVATGLTAGLVAGTRSAAPPHSPPPAHAQAKQAVQLFSPFTGEPVPSLRPIIAVKIDNIVFARPQTGIGKADIVYVIPVEGGLSRFMAIFSSDVPPVIGPVRSAREDDMQLLWQFGRPAFAFSGAQPHLLPVVEHGKIVDLYANRVGGYYRDNSRIAPYNLYARGISLIREAKGASTARNIGFTFGSAPAGGVPTASVSAGYSAASFRFTWSAGHHHWLVWMDGRPAVSTDSGQMSATTVVIQHVHVGLSTFIEWGALPPYAHSVGSGSALVLRDGKAYNARWSRPHLDSHTTFTTRSGQPMNFDRGRVWIVLEP